MERRPDTAASRSQSPAPSKFPSKTPSKTPSKSGPRASSGEAGGKRAAAVEGVRQAAVLAIRGGRVCLVTTSSGRRWVLPKGKGRGKSGANLRQTARREAWEEAGLVGRVAGRPLGRYEFEKGGRRHVVVVFRMRITAAKDDWPERRRRLRDWVRSDALADRIENPALRALVRAALMGRRAA